MADFERKYSDAQKGAIQEAWGDRGVRPAKRISAQAAAGELTYLGELVPAFAVPDTSVREIGGKYLRRRERAARDALAGQAPRDTVEAIRQRIAVALDVQLGNIERLQARGKFERVSVNELQQIGKALRELAALPGPSNEPAQARRPGARDVDGRQDGRTRTGLAAQLLGVKPAKRPAQNDPDRTDILEPGSSSTAGSSSPETAAEELEHGIYPADTGDMAVDELEPGTYARAQAAALLPRT